MTQGEGEQHSRSAGLEDWVTALAVELELDPAVVDVPALLDVARDAAHGVARPAAPVTTFLVGYAAGLAGGGGAAVDTASARASALALRWPGREGD